MEVCKFARWVGKALPVAVLLLHLSVGAHAQSADQPTTNKTTERQDVRLVAPSPEVLLMLVRRTLVALHNANETGNYTVLRDLASSEFRRRNTAAKLSEIFAKHRDGRADMLPILVATPQLTADPVVTADKRLHLQGVFPTSPRQVRFQLAFTVEDGHWRLYGISVLFVAKSAAGFVAPNAKIGRNAIPAD